MATEIRDLQRKFFLGMVLLYLQSICLSKCNTALGRMLNCSCLEFSLIYRVAYWLANRHLSPAKDRKVCGGDKEEVFFPPLPVVFPSALLFIRTVV